MAASSGGDGCAVALFTSLEDSPFIRKQARADALGIAS
jgi:hypothetical protein